MARVSVSHRGRPGGGFGCAGSIIAFIVVVAVTIAVVFAGLIILGVVAAVLVIGLLALSIDRLVLALSPKRRARRANLQRSFLWRPGQVIDATATLEEPKSEPDP